MAKYLDTNGVSHLASKIDERITKRRGIYLVEHGQVTWDGNTFQTDAIMTSADILAYMNYATLAVQISKNDNSVVTLFEFEITDDATQVYFKSALDGNNEYLFAAMDVDVTYAQITGEIRTDIAEKLSDVETMKTSKANIDGSYWQMTVGNAEQLLSTVGITDETPYLFRTSGGSVDIGDRETDKIVGGTVAWNQLVVNGNFSSDANWSWRQPGGGGVENNEGKLIAVNTTLNNQMFQSIALPANHKFLVMFSARKGADNSFSALAVALASNATRNVTKNVTLGTTKADYAVIMTHTAASDNLRFTLTASSLSVGDTAYISNVNLIDLTQMFGPTIADYVYALESSTAGTGIAWLQKYGFFTKSHYSYNAGTLMSVNTSSHNMVGFNAYNPSSGVARLVGGMQYQISGAYTSVSYIDVSGKNETISIDANGYFTPTSNGTLSVTGGNSATTCVHLVWDGERDGKWEQYSEYDYELDSNLELRGIPKLDASNNLYYDGDVYAPNGAVTRKYGIVDLGTLTWTKPTATDWMTFQSNGIQSVVKLPPSTGEGWKIIRCTKYCGALSSTGDNYICINSGGYIRVKDTANASLTGAEFKTLMSGVYLVYELATPTTETADTYTNPQIVDDWGTEEYVDYAYSQGTRDVQIPVGHSTWYMNNLRAKLEMSPNSPNADGLYLFKHENGINTYVAYIKELPDNPNDNGTYVLKLTKNESTATLAWVSE